ncbi:MAG: insulinase family protein [Candidatus Omnitrophica bacterium]|nr:insulinase family protein [Candidatus Omnitrophota bacterium]
MTPSKDPSRLVAETQTFSLPGDSTLLIRPTTTNDILAVSFVLPMGSREEPEELAGMTTLGLRMLTRGTRNRSDFDIAVALESLGASFSTDVQKDRTTLTIQTTGSRWKETFRIIRELLTESIFPEELLRLKKKS